MSVEKITGSNVSESLKIVLVKKGLNIAQLSRMMDLSSTTLYSKFSRGSFTFKDLDKICSVLGISYELTFSV